VTRYNAHMPDAVMNAKVSHRGQTSLPSALRHRWGIEGGGDISFVDLGDAALVLPGGMDRAKAELRAVLAERYEAAVADIADPDLADQK
jgi:bifunctional DNA-binding transcriptional regulator/antitoxin component of YhaV-PrlF toxin-antitoxin module